MRHKSILLSIPIEQFRKLKQWKTANNETWMEFLIDFRLKLWDVLVNIDDDAPTLEILDSLTEGLTNVAGKEIIETRKRLKENGLIK